MQAFEHFVEDQEGLVIILHSSHHPRRMTGGGDELRRCLDSLGGEMSVSKGAGKSELTQKYLRVNSFDESS